MDGNFNNYQDNTANIPYQAPVEENVPVKANGMQIASLVLGICAIVMGCCCWAWIGVVLGVVGVVLSVLGGKNGKHGIGTAGLVCSIVGIVFGVLSIILSAMMMPFVIEFLREMGYTDEMLHQMKLL